MNHTKITDSQWKSIVRHLPKHARLEDQDVMIEPRSIGFYLFLVLVTGGRKCPKSTAQSTAHLGLQNWQQKGIRKGILSGLIKTAHKSNKLNLQKISADSLSVPNKKGAM